MNDRKTSCHQHSKTSGSQSNGESRNRASAVGHDLEKTLQAAMRHAAMGNYKVALGVLQGAGYGPRVRNAQAVCLMRSGNADEAASILRSIVLNPGCTWMRPDVPISYKTNFATALLLAGHPSGCEHILFELHNESNPTVVRLRATIRQWVSGLTFWQRFNWRFGRMEPSNCRVQLDFVPGIFDDPTIPEPTPVPSTQADCQRSAA